MAYASESASAGAGGLPLSEGAIPACGLLWSSREVAFDAGLSAELGFAAAFAVAPVPLSNHDGLQKRQMEEGAAGRSREHGGFKV